MANSATPMNFLRRLGGLATTGGLVAPIAAFIGDFFSPQGGWLVLGIVGFAAIVIAIYLLLSLSRSEMLGGLAPWWHRWTSNDEELSWIWKAPTPLLAHGVHLPLIFGVVCLFAAHKSQAAVQEGGFLGKNIDAIAAAQQQLGISKQILKEQQKTNETLTDIKQNTAILKKETSDDPRKELINFGYQWTEGDLERAVETQDLKAVNLFSQAGFRPQKRNGIIVLKAIESKNQTLFESINKINLSTEFSAFESADGMCGSLFYGYEVSVRESKDWLASNIKALLKNACGNPTAIEQLQKKIDAQNEFIQKASNKPSASELQKMSSKVFKDCLQDENTKMLNIISGAREEFCKKQANALLVNVSAPVSPEEFERLSTYKSFMKIIKG
jgi:hypothetical protein